MSEMSQRAYSRHAGVSLRAVQKAISSGRISVTASGKIDAAQADIDWKKNTDPSRVSVADQQRQAGHDAAKKIGRGLPLDADDLDDDANDDVPAAFGAGAAIPQADAADAGADIATRDRFLSARADREQGRAEKEAIELAVLKGSLISVEIANRLAFTTFRTLRDAVLNVPVRLRDQLAGETDAARVEALLNADLTAALRAVDPTKLMSEQDDNDGGS